jgi:hypothetical protein
MIMMSAQATPWEESGKFLRSSVSLVCPFTRP